MRCKKHISDPSSTVGVCATCLRERLTALIAAQAQAQAQAQLTRVLSRASDDCSRNADPNPPPPPLFPRSVSPYVSRRKSDYSAAWHGCDRLFYSTPQVGPTFTDAVNSSHDVNERKFKKRSSKFWIFSKLFRSRSEKLQSDPSCEQSSSPSPSWFSAIFPARRKNHDPFGMSPATADNFTDECDPSPSGSGFSSECSPRWRKTPAAAANSSRRSRLGLGKSVSDTSMAFCLSPMVRGNHKGLPPEMAAAAEVRAASVAKPHLSTAASFCANRSRKLADFGRVNQNR